MDNIARILALSSQ